VTVRSTQRASGYGRQRSPWWAGTMADCRGVDAHKPALRPRHQRWPSHIAGPITDLSSSVLFWFRGRSRTARAGLRTDRTHAACHKNRALAWAAQQ